MAASKESNGSAGGSGPGVQKVKKVKPPYNLKAAIRSALRLVWRQNPTLQVVLRRERIEKWLLTKKGTPAKKPRVYYKCAACSGEFSQKDIQIDHVDPIGPTPGSKLAPPGLTWDAFIERLFCGPDNLKTVCKPCHSKKTNAETAERWAKMKELDNAS